MEARASNRFGNVALIAGCAAVVSLVYTFLFFMFAVPIAGTSKFNPYLLSVPIAFGPLTALLAIVCGHVARRRRSEYAAAPPRGGAAAIAGLALGYGYWAVLIIFGGGAFLTFQAIR